MKAAAAEKIGYIAIGWPHAIITRPHNGRVRLPLLRAMRARLRYRREVHFRGRAASHGLRHWTHETVR